MTRLLALLLVLAAGPGWAGDYASGARGTTSGGFLKLGAGARASGMGEAFSAAADDASALYWNPAGLSRVEGRSLALMHAAYLDASAFQYLSYAQSAGKGAFGLSLQHFSAGSITETDSSGVEHGSFTPTDLALTAGYSRKGKDGAVGVGLKFIKSKILKSAQTVALDIGLLSRPLSKDRLRLAFTATNLGGSLKYEDKKESLPMTLRLGAAWQGPKGLLSTLDIVAPKDNKPYPALGLEYRRQAGARTRVALRGGYNARAADLDGIAGISMGLGVSVDRLSVDYGVVPFGDLGVTHRIGLSLGF